MTTAERLVQDLCGSTEHPLATSLREWCTSRPFLSFAGAHASKLRKKVREAANSEQQADLQAELQVAAWLLRSGGASLIYEPLKSGGGRGPDFALVLPNKSLVYVEVARLRAGPQDPVYKLARVLADKVGQLPAGAAGVLAAVLPMDTPASALAPDAMRLLARTAQGDPLLGVPLERARTFERLRVRLSGVLLFGTGEGPPVTFWPHGGAAHPVSPAAQRVLR
ncbi:hypothetical protein [Deinococcus sonorensis]|uniref:NERD domain-containing protein n=2 Tax=Deinococcus sonorensis TaxID=309891 RepID=A0AAU7UFN6_9DEIO